MAKSKKAPPKGHAVPPDPYADFPKNDKGKYTSWRSGTPAADTLKVLVHGGALDGMTAGQIQKDENYKQFDKWDNNCFASALSNVCKGLKKEIETARGSGSTAVRTHTTLASIAEDQSYKSAEDSNFEDLSDAVSAISLGDDLTYDTRTIGFRSSAVPGLSRTRSATKHQQEVMEKALFQYGNKMVSLPYLIDQWRDEINDARVSIQIQLLSGSDWNRIIVRVSTCQRFLVIYIPISPFLARADNALEWFFLDNNFQLSEPEKEAMKLVMKVHTKTSGRKTSISKLIGRTTVEGFYHMQRIPLPRKVQHEWASKENDRFFHGKKVITYPDGSSHMYVEMVGVKKDGYKPAETASVGVNHMASPSRTAASPPPMYASPARAAASMPPPPNRAFAAAASMPPTEMEVEATEEERHTAVVLHNHYTNADHLRARRPVKRTCNDTLSEDQEQRPPISNLSVPSPNRVPPAQLQQYKTNGDDDDNWTYQTVNSNATGPLPHPDDIARQQNEQQSHVYASSLQRAAQSGATNNAAV